MTSSKEQSQWGVTVIGDGAIGKTSLLIRFALGTFPNVYVPVVAENYVIEVNLSDNDQEHGDSIRLCLWDTPGQEDYPRLRPLAYANAHTILICFAVDDRVSFENVQEKWAEEAQLERPGLPVVLVGCKEDLRNDPTLVGPGRLIAIEEGSAMAREIGAAGYLESSAKTGQGVVEVFRVAGQRIFSHQTRLEGRRGLKRHCIVF